MHNVFAWAQKPYAYQSDRHIDTGTQPVNILCIHLISLHAIIHLNAEWVYKCEGSSAISACHYLAWWSLFLCIDPAAGWASRTKYLFYFFFFNVEKNTKNYHNEIDGSIISILKINFWFFYNIYSLFFSFKCSTFHSVSTLLQIRPRHEIRSLSFYFAKGSKLWTDANHAGND